METVPEDRDLLDATGLLVTGILLTAFAGFVIVEALRMPRPAPWGLVAAPGLVPFLAGLATFLLSLALTVGALRRGAHLHLGRWTRELVADPESLRLIWIVAITGLYIGLLGRIPFVAATLLFHLLIFFYLKVGGLLKVLVYATTATILVAILLPYLFDMPTP